ncbi:MAG: ShlB/FhaC/HecB family hemolysin secretion/activation protein [Steroidobacteraceae bacterium]
MRYSPLLPMLAALAPLATHAAAAATAPNAGTILQQVQPSAPLPLESVQPGLTIERAAETHMPSGPAFAVKSIRISGNTLFDTATLHALISGAEGHTLTLGQLGEWAARITEHYRGHDYPLAQAVIPAQTIADGMVEIQVIEARYGRISIDNRSRVDERLVRSTLPLRPDAAISQRELDHALLLLSDIPGVAVDATLAAGRLPGTSDLDVEVMSGAAVAGSVTLDGYGNPYTGRARLGGSVALLNPLGNGDVLSLDALSSGGDLNYGRLAYESLLNGRGTHLGASFSALHYDLGGSLKPLDAHGTAQVESAWIRQPLARSQDVNLYGQFQYNRLQLHDRIDAGGIRADRHLQNWTAALSGDWRDGLLSSGVNAWSLGATRGNVAFDDSAAQLIDAASAGTQGRYWRWNAAFVRLQRLNAENALYLAISGQWANGNLDPSDKMISGGSQAVRAYDNGVVSGDTGYFATAEFRHELGSWPGGHWQAVAFVDRARISINRTEWTPAENGVGMTGAGLGLNWQSRQWSGRIHAATPLGATPAVVGEARSVRAWLEVRRSF